MAKKTKVMLTGVKERLNRIFSKTSKQVPSDDWEFKKLADSQVSTGLVTVIAK